MTCRSGRDPRIRATSKLPSTAAAFCFIALGAVLLAACGAPRDAGSTDEHSGEDEHAGSVHFSEAQANAAGITVLVVKRSPIPDRLSLPAEVRFDPDRLSRVSTPIAGVVSDIRAAEGDLVRRGQTLAVISSRELADLKAEYLDAASAEALANREAAREEALWKEQATSEATVQTRRAALARAVAAREAAETKLHAIDIGHDILDGLDAVEDGARSRYSLTAPISGQVIRRTPSIGEAVGSGENAEQPLFVIADASVVWADIAVYRQDLGRIAIGTPVDILGEGDAVLASGELNFISPVIDSASRTATARAVLENPDGRLRPGQFVTARLEIGAGIDVLSVPEAAVQLVEGRPVVFVPDEEGFVPRPVAIGRSGGGWIEIASGLAEGEAYVATGAFTLKAELEKSAFGDGHAH